MLEEDTSSGRAHYSGTGSGFLQPKFLEKYNTFVMFW